MSSYKILKIKIENFRNLENQIIDFSRKINCIFGSNGNGKTNLLEAIYFLINHKSFRKKTSFPQLLGIDSEKPEIIFSALLETNENKRITYSGKVGIDFSLWYLNESVTKRKLQVPLVFINPFDAYHFHNQTNFRRQWFDGYIGLYDHDYKKNIKDLYHSLKIRNTLITKKPLNYAEQIQAIDKNLSKLFIKISNQRLFFLEKLSSFCTDTFFQLFSEKHELTIKLDSKWIGMTSEEVYQKMQVNLKKDFSIGYTVSGLHKDDYTLLFDGINSYEYCSLGQQKMSYLSLLFAYIELFRYKFNSFPIVLIDDVSGELDQVRWSNLIKYLDTREFQVLITTANETFKKELSLLTGVKQININFGLVE